MNSFRSLLFVPGNRPERFARALAAAPDIVCVDLEDAVAPADKEQARAHAADFLSGAEAAPIRAVRVNALATRAGLADWHALSVVAPAASLLVLPKVEEAAELRVADAILAEAGSAARLLALIERPRAIEAAFDIARATPRLAGLILGGVDLAAELGVAPAPEPLAYHRARLVAACHAAGIEAMDVPCLEVRDAAPVAAEAQAAARLAFTGKAAIHPMQLAPIHAAFTPSAEEIEQARRIAAAFAESTTGVGVLDGRLIEKPVARRAERVLARARAAGLG